MKIGDFGMSRQIIMASSAMGEMGLERALSSNIIGTAAYCAPELLLAESPVKRNKASAATILKSDVSHAATSGAAGGLLVLLLLSLSLTEVWLICCFAG